MDLDLVYIQSSSQLAAESVVHRGFLRRACREQKRLSGSAAITVEPPFPPFKMTP